MRVVLNSRRSSLPRESAEVTGAESPLLSSSLLSYPLRSDFFLIRAQGRERKRERELQQQSTSRHRHCWPPLSRMMKPGMCCSDGSPERVEGPAPAGIRQKMGTGATRSGSRCSPLLLLLLLGSSCHMLHGQGMSFTLRSPGFRCQMMHLRMFIFTYYLY